MVINFVGLFGTTGSGEISDETHLARSMEELGHTVRKIPRDEWREHVIDGKEYPHVPKDLQADISIICKWHHFYDGRFITQLKKESRSPVFYWVWDSVDLGIDWHRDMAVEADLYLSGELGRVQEFRKNGIRFYYFQMDVVDGDMPIYINFPKKYDVIYLGSCDNQNGRVDLLKAINKEIQITVFGQGDWAREGFVSNAPVYGKEANKIITEAKIVLGTSCDPHLYGYWSNRVGRVLFAKGKLLQQYAPGMENFLHDWVEYFSTADEAVKKIKELLENKYEGYPARKQYSQYLWTSYQKIKDLLLMTERYLKENNGKDWLLP